MVVGGGLLCVSRFFDFTENVMGDDIVFFTRHVLTVIRPTISLAETIIVSHVVGALDAFIEKRIVHENSVENFLDAHFSRFGSVLTIH